MSGFESKCEFSYYLSPKFLESWIFFQQLQLFSSLVCPVPCFPADHNFTRKESTINPRLLVPKHRGYIYTDKIRLCYIQADKQHQKVSSGTGIQSAIQVRCYSNPWPCFWPQPEQFLGNVQELACTRDHSQQAVWMQAPRSGG